MSPGSEVKISTGPPPDGGALGCDGHACLHHRGRSHHGAQLGGSVGVVAVQGGIVGNEPVGGRCHTGAAVPAGLDPDRAGHDRAAVGGRQRLEHLAALGPRAPK